MALIDDVKQSLRVSHDSTDIEINDLIAASKIDLKIAGVDDALLTTPDALLKRAIILYCKLHYGWDNPDYERLEGAYLALKKHITLSEDYLQEGEL